MRILLMKFCWHICIKIHPDELTCFAIVKRPELFPHPKNVAGLAVGA